MGLLAMALNCVVGFGGLVSLCHAAFFGLAGYVLALAAPQYEAGSLWLTLPLAVAAVVLAALAIGALSLRTRGVYFIMVTLAFGEMLFFLFHDTKIAGGSDGTFVYYKPEAMIGGFRLLDLEKAATFYWVVLAIMVASIALLHAIVRSPFGHALAAARVNERRARSLGFPIYRIRLTAFVVSGALAGVAGYFAAAQFGYVAPQWSGLLVLQVQEPLEAFEFVEEHGPTDRVEQGPHVDRPVQRGGGRTAPALVEALGFVCGGFGVGPLTPVLDHPVAVGVAQHLTLLDEGLFMVREPVGAGPVLARASRST